MLSTWTLPIVISCNYYSSIVFFCSFWEVIIYCIKNEEDYKDINILDELEISYLVSSLYYGEILIKNITSQKTFIGKVNLTEKEIKVIKAGGRLNFVKINS